MKVLKTEDDIKSVISEKPSLIELGTPETCMPCKMLQDILHTFENDKTFGNMEYYSCSDVNTIMGMGYSSLPVLIMVTDKIYDVETDSSILIDEEELTNWIESRL